MLNSLLLATLLATQTTPEVPSLDLYLQTSDTQITIYEDCHITHDVLYDIGTHPHLVVRADCRGANVDVITFTIFSDGFEDATAN